MDLLRPARPDDLEGILALAQSVGVGMTTMPIDRDFVQDRLRRTAEAFAHAPRRPGGEEYLFVVEGADGRVLATSAIVSRVGGFDPFYTYELRPEPVVHAPLGVDRTVGVLHVKADHKGPAELCSLVVAPDARRRGVGRLASLGRLLFIAAHPARFADRIIAEVRGFQDPDGVSPFWNAVGRVFFAPTEFAQADTMTGIGEKDFIADLMPRHPIYVDLLAPEVQAIIGRPHRDAEPAMRLLEAERFHTSREVDIFDAGPLLECETAAVRTVRDARRLRLGAEPPAEPELDALVAVVGPDGIRVARDLVSVRDGIVAMRTALLERLSAAPGDDLLVVEARGAA